jgi:hypothetical protein
LKAKIAILCKEGFEIIGLSESESAVVVSPIVSLTCNEQP